MKVRVPVGATRWLRWGSLSLAAVVALLAVTSDPADARYRRKRHHFRAAAAESYNPPYAAIVVDARTGAVLHQSAPDASRHPASLTKIMTLYLLFERLETGRINLDTRMEVSEHAASQAPTKLGLEPGDTLRVEDAIKGLVTKSANDAAVVLAEALGGSEEEFARQMTRKARTLGMRNTVYRNANGLPDDEQVTTARDQALLGIAIQERFPRYYKYFSLPSFVYHGRSIANHNHLLGRVEGVDGIKTGYTRASGFNLVTSVRRGARHIVAVVLGGRSGRQRDAKMRDLISSHIAEASTKDVAAPVVVASAETSKPEAPRVDYPKADPSRPELLVQQPRLASAVSTPVALAPPQPVEATATVAAANAPLTPVKVKTVAVKLVPPKHTSKDANKEKPVAPAGKTAAPAPAPAVQIASAEPEALPARAAAAHASAAQPGVLGTLPAMVTAAKNVVVTSAKADEAPIQSAPAHHTTRGGWIIQVGAFEDLSEAKERLSSAQSAAAALLQKTEPYTERTSRGDKTYFRARFAGLDRDRAEAVCRRLKRNDLPCMAIKL